VISKFAREQVSDQDISRLHPGQWLNDEIINFYGAMILGRSEGSKENPAPQANGKKLPKKILLNVYYLSSFFWSKLSTDGYEKGRLAKWTKKVSFSI
jgi:sentrin-specific protease 1